MRQKLLENPAAVQDEPRAGERSLTIADRIFYAALFCLLVFVLFGVDGSIFTEATR